MKNISGFLIVLVVFSLVFTFGQQRFSRYLLEKELSSDKKVTEITTSGKTYANFSQEPVFNNLRADYLIRQTNLVPYILNANYQLDLEKNSQVLGVSDRWIEINLSEQRLYGWEGNNQIYNYLVSTGKWAATPTGNFAVWTKLASTTMSGGSKALGTYYYLPNVPCTMYFHKGYGIHGTYWHDNFGTPMSHGCVNMRTPEACELFNWASVGTPVRIHY